VRRDIRLGTGHQVIEEEEHEPVLKLIPFIVERVGMNTCPLLIV